MKDFQELRFGPDGLPRTVQCVPVYEKPIRHIGKFYDRLTKSDQEKAKSLARRANRMAKIDIEREVYRLSKRTEIKNYVG